MERVQLTCYKSAEDLAQSAAARWLTELQADPREKPFSVALSGGRIARLFLTRAAQLVVETKAAVEYLDFYWADERCVPPEDPESNFGLARECLLRPLGIDARRIHRILGENDRHLAVSEAEGEVRRQLAPDETGQPVLDLVFLGMGEDGHIASLFPGEPEEVMNSPMVYRGVVGPKPPPFRVTLNYPALRAARRVWVLASGRGKEEALRASLGPEVQTPLGRLLRMRKETWILTDLPVERAGGGSESGVSGERWIDF
jgi:6-phosphogluconolactonase